MQFFFIEVVISTGVAEELSTGDVVVNKRDSCLSATTNSVEVTSGERVEGSSNGAIPVCTAKKTTVRYFFNHVDQ